MQQAALRRTVAMTGHKLLQRMQGAAVLARRRRRSNLRPGARRLRIPPCVLALFRLPIIGILHMIIFVIIFVIVMTVIA